MAVRIIQSWLRNLYYDLRPLIPRRLQILIRRLRVKIIYPSVQYRWSISYTANGRPDNWQNWPNQKKFAFVILHDVETKKGVDRTKDVLELEKKLGFKSSFNFVPERYKTPPELISMIEEQGFEVGVQGLKHDGKLYKSEHIFNKRAQRINEYIQKWQAVGFRSPAMHHQLEWLLKLNIEYDSSTFDTDPFEPQPDGIDKVFPFIISNGQKSIVELPYTLAQDFTLFILQKESSIRIWQEKLDWLVEQGGMALVTVHPDYMCFDKGKCNFDEYPARLYESFLTYVVEEYKGQYWNALPRDVARFWREKYSE